MKKLIVHETSIQMIEANGFEYICLTDMMKAKDGAFFVTDWLRNRNTLEYIGIWEQLTNPSFNYGEFATIKSINSNFNYDQLVHSHPTHGAILCLYFQLLLE
jgi:hypothetical protein